MAVVDTAMKPAHAGLNSHRSLWTDVTCGELVSGQQVVTIDAELPVEQAAEVLVKNGISSAPVYNKQTQSYTGMFDYRDLVSYILIVFNKKQWLETEDIEIKEIVRRAMSCQPVQVKLVADLSHKNPFYSVTPDTSLLQAMDVFAKGIHRVAVVGTDGQIRGILTQSNVANFLYGKLNLIPSAQKSVADLGLAKKDVIAVNAESQVFAAMQLMQEHGISSVPLVDHGGRLLGSLSMTDIKYVLRGFRYNLLWRSCFQFISHVRSHQGLVEDGGKDRYPVFECRESDSLARAMGKMGATRSHRVWIVDADGNNKLVGLVSLTDTLKALLPPENVE